MQSNTNNSNTIRTAVDIAIKLGILFLLLAWCFQIMSPFISIVFWGLIIAITLFPLYRKLSKNMGDKKKLAAVIISLIMLSIIIVPSVIFTESMVQGVQAYSQEFDREDLEVPPPDEKVADWPVVGNTLYDLWKQASDNPESLVKSYSSQLKAFGSWLLMVYSLN